MVSRHAAVMAGVFNAVPMSIAENTDGRAINATSGAVMIARRIRTVLSVIHKTMINYFCGLFSKPPLAAHVPYKKPINNQSSFD
jgi:hypothetical protein